MRLLWVLLSLSLAVLAHEYGHYLAMKANGVEVVELAVGFGPTLYHRTMADGTELMIKALPLGGYTRPADGAMEALGLAATEQIAFAGMLVNTLIAIPFLILLFALGGETPFTQGRGKRLPGWLRPLVLGIGMPFVVWLTGPYVIVRGIIWDPKTFLAGITGPIGVAREGKDVSLIGRAVNFWVVLNVGLAGFNLIPFLPFDGGHAALPLVAMLGDIVMVVYMAASFVVSGALYIAILFGFRRKRPTAPS